MLGMSNSEYYDEAGPPKSLKGLEWKDLPFVSTGADAGRQQASNEVSMRVLVPKGTRAFSHTEKVAFGGVEALKGPSGGLDFDEILLDRGLTFRVVADHGFRRTRYDGTPDVYSGRDLDVEIIAGAS